MADSSFDIVSKFDRCGGRQRAEPGGQGVEHPVRLRGTDTTIAWKGDEVIGSSAPPRAGQGRRRRLQEKLIRRDISMKAFDAGDPQPSGKTYRVSGTLKQGIDQENAKKINKLIRDEGPKGVKTQVQGDEIRVSSKKRDDLQAVIALLKGSDLDVALQFVNYR